MPLLLYARLVRAVHDCTTCMHIAFHLSAATYPDHAGIQAGSQLQQVWKCPDCMRCFKCAVKVLAGIIHRWGAICDSVVDGNQALAHFDLEIKLYVCIGCGGACDQKASWAASQGCCQRGHQGSDRR